MVYSERNFVSVFSSIKRLKSESNCLNLLVGENLSQSLDNKELRLIDVKILLSAFLLCFPEMVEVMNNKTNIWVNFEL